MPLRAGGQPVGFVGLQAGFRLVEPKSLQLGERGGQGRPEPVNGYDDSRNEIELNFHRFHFCSAQAAKLVSPCEPLFPLFFLFRIRLCFPPAGP